MNAFCCHIAPNRHSKREELHLQPGQNYLLDNFHNLSMFNPDEHDHDLITDGSCTTFPAVSYIQPMRCQHQQLLKPLDSLILHLHLPLLNMLPPDWTA